MKTLISIKTDIEVKRGIQRIAQELGIPLSTIVNAYFKRLLRERRVDFSLPLMPNKKTAGHLRRAHEDYIKGRNISPAFESAKDAIAWLNEKS